MGKSKPSFVRMTISFSRELKARMDKVKEPLNWSAVAARAFETTLGEIANRKVEKTMEDVVYRLRASLRDDEDESYKPWFSKGQDWARKNASARQLKRLSNAYARCGTDWNVCFDPHGNWFTFAQEIEGDPDLEFSDAQAFWDGALGEESTDADGHDVRAFLEGALDVWYMVQSKL
jgi:hypothetical protein